MAERRGRKYEVIKVSSPDEKTTVEKNIYELSDEELKECKSLGVAYGIDFMHCLCLAFRHCKNFGDRVYGYKQESSDKVGFSTKVSFYEKQG